MGDYGARRSNSDAGFHHGTLTHRRDAGFALGKAMGWSLEIHHIDVVGRGDSTLILAKNGGKVQRSMLVDGGQSGGGNWYVTPYLKNKLNLTTLDVVVSTHYDDDHVSGLSFILRDSAGSYLRTLTKDTIVYDQGMPSRMDFLSAGSKAGNQLVCQRNGMGTAPDLFLKSIGSRVHPTKNCFPAGCTGPFDASQKEIVDIKGDYLLGKELLWAEPTGPRGVYSNGARGALSPNQSGAFVEHGDNRPTVRCIAVNGYVLNGRDSQAHLIGALTDDKDGNGKSIALEVCFGAFRYYVGGDLTQLQEDGQGSTVGLRGYLEGRGEKNKKGPLSAMKASHHGSQHSTSELFLKSVQPKVVVISNGLENIYDHPDQDTIRRLDSSAAVKQYFLTGRSNGRKPPLVLGDKGKYAGVSRLDARGRHIPGIPGDVVITVDALMEMTVHINSTLSDLDPDDDAPYFPGYVYKLTGH